MSEMPGSITVYDPSMAADVAAMFNDFNALWPGGFGGGVPYTEQRVHDWLDATSAVADLIALDADGAPIGYLGLYPNWRDRHACYVTILGVVPRAKGQKVGKRLLLRAIDLAIQRGYTRLDLNTWAGNMDAVPLYKKTGLFWVPGTTVSMQNYLPALVANPLGRAWFERHPDWYGCFERALTQSPDQETHGAMEVYTYRFREGDDLLIAEADRYGWGLCSVDSTLGGSRLAVSARLDSHTVLMGMPNALTIEVTNATGVDLDVALTVEPFSGLTWVEPLPLTMAARNGETSSVARAFVAGASAVPYDAHEASATIKVRALVGGEVVDLLVGAKIVPAVALRYVEEICSLPAGGRDRVTLDVANNAQESLSGVVESLVEGVPEAAIAVPFALAGNEVSSVTVPVALAAESEMTTVRIQAFLEHEGSRSPMPAFSLPVVSDQVDAAVAVMKDDGSVLHLVTDLLDVRAELRGGDLSLGRRWLPDVRRPAYFQIGPPYGMNLDGSIRYDYRLVRDGNAVTLVLSAESRHAPGLRIDKMVRVTPTGREIEHWITLTATRPGMTRAGGRFSTGGYGGGIALNPYSEPEEFFTPVAGAQPSEGGVAEETCIVACDAQLNLLTETVVPQAPEQWPESWTAVRNRVCRDLAAWIWRSDGVAKVKVSHGMLSSLECGPRELAAGETMEVAHLWFGLAYASVTEVRQRWAQLVGHRTLSWRELRGYPEPVPPVSVHWVGDARAPAGATVRKEIILDLPLPVELDGDLSLVVPEGWGGSLLDATVDIAQLLQRARGSDSPRPVALQAELMVPAEAFGTAAMVRLLLRGELEMAFDLPLMVDASDEANGSVSVVERVLEGRPVFSVDGVVASGRRPSGVRFDVMADAGGNLIRLEDAEGRQLLHDVFPACEPRFFLTYYTGGVQPVVLTPTSSQFVYPPERVTARTVTEGSWRGVEVAWVIGEQEELRGQRVSLTYLVAAGVNIVRIRSLHENPTPRLFRCTHGVVAFAGPQICGEDSSIAVPGAAQDWVRHPASRGFVGPSDLRAPWAWFTAGASALGVLCLSERPTAPTALSFGEFTGAILYADGEIQPGEPGRPSRSVAEFALVVNRPQCEAENLLAALRALWRRDPAWVTAGGSGLV
ncbi:MAG: GNAT family N-acetyltransferase [Anaerolineae bacterium]|jgi:GNAT superfamily N-acetyltransferase|nr:GNAT family N-acetyltransferase [Anaerolineae bacterium]